MRITEVTLEDIKSYENRTTVPIEDGVTAILGENGAGKSTIQEAIGFALFDSLPFNNKDFVREGASSGTVAVTFEQATQGETERFRVIRSVGRSQYGVHRYDTETEEWLDQDIDSKTALVRWLCTRFDVEDADELQSLWKSCIGVPQTRFLSDFSQTTRNRKQTFDSLLNLDAYEASWQTLKDVPDAIEKHQRDLRDEIQTLTGAVQSLPEQRAQAQSLASEIEDIETTIDRKTAQLSEKQAEYDRLTGVQEEIESFEQKIESVSQEIGATESKLATATDELGAAEAAREQCETNREGYLQYKEADKRRDELESKKNERDALVEKRNEQQQTISTLTVEVKQLEDTLNELAAARETIDTHQAEKERYEELDNRIDSLKQRTDEVEALRGEITALESEIEETETDATELKETVTEIEAEWEETPDPETIADEINEQEAQQKQLAAERDRLETQLQRLRDTDVDAPCPTCDRPLSAKHRADAIEDREDRINEIETERERRNEELAALRDRRETAQAVSRRADKLPLYREKIESLESTVAELRDEKAETKTELAELEADLKAVPELEAEREELEETYEAYETAAFRVQEHADVPDRLQTKRKELDDERSTLAEIETELEEYDGVDDELAGIKATMNETQSAYQTYIKHQQQASHVEDRREAVEELRDSLDTLEQKRSDQKAALEDTKTSFDADRFSTLESEIEALKGEIERTKGTLETKEETLSEVRETIQRLEEKLETRQEKLQQLKELKADQQFANWVRENVREAGPKMREIITDRISAQANDLFRSIRGVSAETLEWTSDYEIVVHDADVQKSFSTLSGGEKMAAALAVRLAILEQLASVGVAFLDEPTANLDRQKKRNLVSQLKQLDSFEQLTVISHDETFDSMTDYTISIKKDQQTSEVVVN